MHRIDTIGATANNLFQDATSNTDGTVVDSDWLNGVQEEIVSVIEDQNITLNKESNSQLLLALSNMITNAFSLEDWHIVGEAGEPSYQNGWTSYNVDPTSGWGGAAFFKDPFGIVHLRGLVDNGTPDSTIFTLPTGYRPQIDQIVAGIQSGSPETGVRVEIMNDGTVETRSAVSGWISLSGIQFRVGS